MYAFFNKRKKLIKYNMQNNKDLFNIIEYSKVSKSNTLFFPKMYLFISLTYPDFNSTINSKILR